MEKTTIITSNKVNVLFIDDDRATNFFNQRVAKNANIFESISVQQNPKSVIDCFKKNKCIEKFIKPHIIFLDINMPGMNGWEFLEAFYQIPKKIRENVKIVMLSTSNEEDKAKQMNRGKTIIGYAKKPLSKDFLAKITNVYKNLPEGGGELEW